MASSAPMPSNLPPQLIIAWLPTRDVGAALRVSKDWCAAPEPIFQAIAGRHGLRRVEPSWRATVRQYRSYLGDGEPELTLDQMRLVAASRNGNGPAIQSLINKGVNPNFVGGDGQTPLHAAAMYGQLNALNVLIAAGADINAQSRKIPPICPRTPLHAAASSLSAPLARRCDCARRLLQLGANARLLNADEDAPYQCVADESRFHYSYSLSLYTAGDGVRIETLRQFLKEAFHAQRE
jgi:hypothetical protein